MDDLAGYFERVVHFVESLGFPWQEARDIAQDAFARVLKHKEQYRGDAKWAFLETTTRYEVANAIRRKKAQKRAVTELSIDDLPHLADSVSTDVWSGRRPLTPEEELIHHQEADLRAKRLAAAIGQLGQITRTCLNLWLGGSKYREIAAITGLTINAVKSRLHEVKSELRERLGEEPEGIRLPALDRGDDDGQE